MSKVISEVEDPTTGDTIHVAKGKIERLLFKEIDGGADRFGNTHKASIAIGGEWINQISIKVNEGFEPQLRINAGTRQSPDWVNIEQGDDVRITVTPNEYNGKTYYNSQVSKIKLVKKGDGGKQQTSQQSLGNQGAAKAPYTKKDNTQVVAGNARTAAFELHRFDEVFDVEAINATIAELVVYSDNKRKEYASSNPDLDDFQVGVSVGQAVVLAAQTVESVEELDAVVNVILDEIIPFSVEQVKSVSAEKPKAPAKAVKTTKPAAKVTTRKAQEVQAAEDLGIDDDIPF